MRLLRRLQRVLLVAAKAVVCCRCQRAAPTLTTVLELAALAAPLIKTHDGAAAAGSDSGTDSAASSSSSSSSVASGPGAARLLAALVLRLARGWAPAVVVAQGVRLVGSIVQQREAHDDGKAGQEGSEVRALQLGLSVVPRVDPRVLRSLEQYACIYREWLLLLRGRLAQACLELPEGLFDPGLPGDEELMRFALCYNLLQARSLKDALLAMDRTIANIRQFAAWHARYAFIPPGDLEAWQRIAWWEGPDDEGHLWLMIDFRAAVQASRTHGAELVARVLVSNMEYGVRQLMPELGCASTLRVVVDTSGVHVGAALRMRGVLGRVGHVIDRMYPCRLQVLYMVGLPFPLRWALRAAMQLLHAHTRRKIRLCRATDVPRRLPSQLRSHKLSVAAGLDAWAFVDSQGYPHEAGLADATTAAGSVVGSELGDAVAAPFTPRTPLQRGDQPFKPGGGGAPGGPRRFRWRRGGGAGAARLLTARQRLRRRVLWGGALGLGLVLLLAAAVALLLHLQLARDGGDGLRRLARAVRLSQR